MQLLDECCGLFVMLHVYIQENGLDVVLASLFLAAKKFKQLL